MKKPYAAEDAASLSDRLLRLWPSLAPAARRVAQFIDCNRAAVLAASALEVAVATETSDATVVRTVQALGFSGLGDLKKALVAELGRSTPADNMRRTLAEAGENAQQSIAAVLDAHAESIEMLRSDAARASILAATIVLQPAERIVVFGIGPSASIAGYLSMMLRRW
jgi:DNA-binding MurR/RpiR family transcriptional regulator